jgi:hypothetical protein
MTLIPILLAVSVTQAHALRGINPGAKCEMVEAIEVGLGSALKGADLPPGTTDPTMKFFDGRHLGHAAIISYRCHDGVVGFQIITTRFAHEEEARAAFSDFRDALITEFGAPTKDLDERVISQLREEIPTTGGGPLERFTSWVTGHRVVSLMLSGEHDTWEIIVSGP